MRSLECIDPLEQTVSASVLIAAGAWLMRRDFLQVSHVDLCWLYIKQAWSVAFVHGSRGSLCDLPDEYTMVLRMSMTYAFLYLITLRVGSIVPNLIVPASPSLSFDNAPNSTHTPALQTSTDYPITCFHHMLTKLNPVTAEDCDFIINNIIVGYPNPMAEQIWGYIDGVDIDLRLQENRKWVHGRCVVFVREDEGQGADMFRPVDVASTALRLLEKCIVGVKKPVGGTVDIGSRAGYFYVGIAAPFDDWTSNATVLALP